MNKTLKILSCLILLLTTVSPLDAQWRVVNRLNNGSEIQSVSENYSVNREGNYVISVKRYFPNFENNRGFYERNHVTNITIFEIHANLKYRCIGDEWLDTNGKRTEYKDYESLNSRDRNNGWKTMNPKESSTWGKLWRKIIDILPSRTPK
ncbi:MAG: hypothetical protein HDS74_07960 [Bacteroidales bacterium]|nr:hypothetical protein [Bacteroidales bacterium]